MVYSVTDGAAPVAVLLAEVRALGDQPVEPRRVPLRRDHVHQRLLVLAVNQLVDAQPRRQDLLRGRAVLVLDLLQQQELLPLVRHAAELLSERLGRRRRWRRCRRRRRSTRRRWSRRRWRRRRCRRRRRWWWRRRWRRRRWRWRSRRRCWRR